MSSHHIVKDGQEPALLIIDSYFDERKLSHLLEWNPLVIVADKAIERVLSMGIKVDVVYCHSDLDVKNLVNSVQNEYELLSYREEVFFKNLFSYLRKKQQKGLNILTGKTLTTDDWESLKELKETISIVVFEMNCRKHFIEKDEFTKWLPAQSIFRIIPFSDQSGFELHGDVSPLEENLYQLNEDGTIRIIGIRGDILFEEKLS